jgi:hypothetical protein
MQVQILSPALAGYPNPSSLDMRPEGSTGEALTSAPASHQIVAIGHPGVKGYYAPDPRLF